MIISEKYNCAEIVDKIFFSTTSWLRGDC